MFSRDYTLVRDFFCPILQRPLFDAVIMQPCGHRFSQEEAKRIVQERSGCPEDKEEVVTYRIDYSTRLLTIKQLYKESLQGFPPERPSSQMLQFVNKGKEYYLRGLYHKAMLVFAKVLWHHPGIEKVKKYLALTLNAEDPFDPVPIFNSYHSPVITENQVNQILALARIHNRLTFSKFIRQIILSSSLNFQECPGIITDRIVSLIVRDCPYLTIIDLSYCSKVTDLGLKAIASYSEHLKKLNLAFCFWKISDWGSDSVAGISDSGIMQIAMSCTNLLSLNVTGFFSSSDQAIQARASWITTPELGPVGTYRKNLTPFGSKGYLNSIDYVLRVIATYCAQLVELALKDLPIHKFPLLFHLVHNCTQLQKLDIPKIREVEITKEWANTLLEFSDNCSESEFTRILQLILPEASSFYLSHYSDKVLCLLAKYYPNTACFDLSSCSMIDNDTLETITRSCRKLTHLNLLNCTQLNYEAIFSTLLRCDLLEDFRTPSLPNISKQSSKLIAQFFSIVPKKSTLTRVMDLFVLAKRNYIPGRLQPQDIAVIQQLAKICKENEFTKAINLFIPTKDLNFQDCHQEVTDEIIQLIAEHSAPPVLDLSNCSKITDQSLQSITKSKVYLKKIILTGCHQITYEGLISIAFGCKFLEEIELPKYPTLSLKQIKIIAQLLNECEEESETIRILNLLNIAKRPTSDIFKLKSQDIEIILEFSNICIPPIFTTFISHFIPTKALSFSDCGYDINDEIIRLISNLFPHFTSLDLANCSKITESGFFMIAKFCSNLTKLSCSNNIIDDESIERLALLFPHLTHLHFADCSKITERGFLVIAKGCKSLTHLTLGKGNEISDETFETIIIKNPNLSHLDLSKCSKVNDDWLTFIANHCKNLIFLDLSSLYFQVTEQAIISLLVRLPKLSNRIKIPNYIASLPMKVIVQSLKTPSQFELKELIDICLPDTKSWFDSQDAQKYVDNITELAIQFSKLSTHEELKKIMNVILKSHVDSPKWKNRYLGKFHSRFGVNPQTGAPSQIDKSPYLCWVTFDLYPLCWDLSDPLVTDEIIQLLAPHLNEYRINSINLSRYSKVTDKGLRAISNYCTKYLIHLNLEGCVQITEKGLLSCLQFFLGLQTLSLPNGITLHKETLHSQYTNFLWKVSSYDKFPVFKTLLEAVKHCNYKSDKEGNTALHLAIARGKLDVVQWFYKEKSLLFQKENHAGRTPLYYAIKEDQLAMIHLLYQQDPLLLKKRDDLGKVAAHQAASWGRMEIIKWMYQQGPSLFQDIDNEGRTPLHWAVKFNKLEVVQWLYKENPLLFEIGDNEGKTPLDYAKQEGLFEITHWAKSLLYTSNTTS